MVWGTHTREASSADTSTTAEHDDGHAREDPEAEAELASSSWRRRLGAVAVGLLVAGLAALAIADRDGDRAADVSQAPSGVAERETSTDPEPDVDPAPTEAPVAAPGAAAENVSDVPATTDAPPQPVPGGRTVHVAPSGSDSGTGEEGAPFESLARGLEELRPGDTLVVAGGTYREQITDVEIRPATAERPIRVVAAPGERPVVEGLLWLVEPSHWEIRGINVTWSGRNDDEDHMVKITGGEGWTFSHAEVWDARSYAAILVAGEPEDFRLSHLYVHDTHDTNETNQDHLVYLNCGDGGGVLERSILARSPNGRAVKVGGPDGDADDVANLVIRYNTMYDNRGPSNIQLSRGARDNRIYRNIMVRSSEGMPNVTGWELDGDNNVVHDNVGFESSDVVEEGEDGLTDGGGNRMLDPRLEDPRRGRFRPLEPEAAGYGRWAPEGG